MKRFGMCAFILALSLATIYVALENNALQQQLLEKEMLAEQLRTDKEVNDLKLFQMKQTTNRESDYVTWMSSTQLAETLYADSDGLFEKEWGLFLGEMTQAYDMDPYIVYELLRMETGGSFDPTLVGPKTRYGHAYGMAQFMKNTAPWIAERANLPYDDQLLFDPLYSIQLSVEYLHYLYDRYNDWNYALTAYNRGMFGLEKYIQKNGHAESVYAAEIQSKAKRFQWLAYNEQ